MLDRLLKIIVVLILLLFLLQCVIGVLSRILEASLRGLVSSTLHVGSILGGVLVAVGLTCFLVGLLARIFRFAATRDPRAARELASRERAMRQRPRRPAEGVPSAVLHRGEPADLDPAVGEDEEDH